MRLGTFSVKIQINVHDTMRSDELRAFFLFVQTSTNQIFAVTTFRILVSHSWTRLLNKLEIVCSSVVNSSESEHVCDRSLNERTFVKLTFIWF